jgi:pyridoxal phosphate enzyme (YggS family)
MLVYHNSMSNVNAAQIAKNIKSVRGKIRMAAHRAGRDPDEITLVAVSKTFPSKAIIAAVEAGMEDIGESRVQEGIDKISDLGRITRWHLIGHLQSNKVKKAVEYFDVIQSLDSMNIAEKVSEQAVQRDKTIPCLIEMNSSGEESKFGFPTEETTFAAVKISQLPGIDLRGLMTIGPWTANEGCIRKAFDLTRQTFEKMQTEMGKAISVLSMGMSSDYELAIECGSTMVRVGTAIFGVR